MTNVLYASQALRIAHTRHFSLEWLALGGALLIAGVLLCAVAQLLRGKLRILLATSGLVVAAASLLGSIVFLTASNAWGRGDVLSLVGLLVTVLITLAGSEYLKDLRRLRVGVVIPSTRPFHRELRRGLISALDASRSRAIDPYLEAANPDEDLSAFLPILGECLGRGADVLVICAPAVDLAEAQEVVSLCRGFTRRGGSVFFVESSPSADVMDDIGWCTSVVSDSGKSASLLAELARGLLREVRSGSSHSVKRPAETEVLIVPGPAHSRPAKERADALCAALHDACVEVLPTLTWTAHEAEEVVVRHLADHGGVQIICCGNDDMARGAARAVHQLDRRDVFIVGHDGIYEAVVAISDPFSPLAGTVRIPPQAFGYRIGGLIAESPRDAVHLPQRVSGRLRRKHSRVVLPLSRANLVTHHNAPLLLYG